MTRKKILFILGLILVGVLGLYLYKYSNFTKVEQKKELKKIRVSFAVGNKTMSRSFFIDFPEDKKIFEKNGLKIEKVIVTTNPVLALATGSSDISFSFVAGSLVDYLNGVDLKAIAFPFKSFDQSAISRFPKDEYVKIKKVGLSRIGGGMHVFNITALKNIGVNYKNVEFVAVGSPTSGAEYLKRGRIDFRISDNKKEIREAANNNYGIWSPKEISANPPMHEALVTTSKTIKKNSEALNSFILSIYESMQYIENNKKETIAYLIKKYNLSDAEANEFYDRLIDGRKDFSFIPTLESITPIADIIKSDFKPTNPNRNISDYIYKDFAEKAVSQGAK